MLNYEYPPLGGGAASACQSLLEVFSRIPEIEVDLVTSSPNKFFKENLGTNITIHRLDIGKKMRNGHYQKLKDLLTYTTRAFFFSRQLMGKNKYDLIHAWFGVPSGFIAMLLRLPYIVALRGMDVPGFSERFKYLNNYIFKYLDQVIWGRARFVVANSCGLKELALKTRPLQDIEVIGNGINTELFSPRPHQGENKVFYVLSTSRLTARKGIYYLIQGFSKFHKEIPNSKLILAGNGDQKGELFALVKKLDLDCFVEFANSIPHEEIHKTYQKADVFVLPSLNEGMSNSLLEAMACQLPVIVTDTGGTRELVDKTNGIIVEKRSSVEISEALKLLYTDKEIRFRMGHSGRSKALKLSWINIAEKYIKLYKSALEQ